MFRSLSEDHGGGFVNEGLEVSESCDDKHSNNALSVTLKDATEIQITRSSYDIKKLHEEMNYKQPQSKSIFASQFTKLKSTQPKSCFIGFFPIFSWLHSYKKDDFVGDLISGCTVAIIQIPQGMGYALLGNLPPVVGIYMAFFPVLLYVIFGTSRHNSMGTFAVVSIMVGKTINTYANPVLQTQGGNSTDILPVETGHTPIQIATAICFIVGVIHIIMYVCRLGILSFLLSETLVSGFTTAAAIHVLTSQLKDIFGLTLPSIKGNFKLIKTYIELFKLLPEANQVAMLLSVVTIIVLIVNNEWLKPRIAKRTILPIPIELIIVVGGTLLSKYTRMEEKWDIIPVGNIPVGLPEFTVPDFSLWKDLIVDSIAIAFVSYSVTVSMALIFGQKLNYEIGFNQELLAMGAGNIFGSFFSCFPFSASLSRSLIQQTVGGRTQIASVISCILLLFVLLWIGPFFEVLPRCILASVVIVALKTMLFQVTQFFKFKKKSKSDGFIWLATFLTVIIISIDIGLLVGIVLSILCIFCNSLIPYVCLLGNIPSTDLFLDIKRFDKAIELPFIKIFHYNGSLNFATKTAFKNKLCSILDIDILKELKNIKNPNAIDSISDHKIKTKKFITKLMFNHLVLDFSALTYIDPSSVTMLTSLINDFTKLSVKVTITGCSCKIYETMIISEFSHMHILYPTIHDAVFKK
ncbi:unnamed protein product [Diamesa hyperborea]